MTPFSADDIAPDGPKPRPKGHIPYPPGRDATFSELRHYGSNGIGAPPAVRIDTMTRGGRGEEDSMTFYLSNEMVLRCDRQKRLLTPRGFQTFFASETDGLCQPQHLTQAEIGDMFTVFCRLATATVEHDELSELTERLLGFVNMCEVLHVSLTPEYRYSTLRRLQAREEYDRKAATEGKGSGRAPVRPVLVADHEWGADGAVYLIRHSEFITHLRVVHMLTMSDNFLKGRMTEIGCEYHALQAHGPGRRAHPHLAFYTLAPEMPIPHHGDE